MNYNVPSIQIDGTLNIHPVGSRTLADPGSGSYYFFFHTDTLTSIDHFAAEPGASHARQRLLYLETHPGGALDRTVKGEDLLKGPFGHISAVKECFYNSPMERGYSSVSVGLENEDIEQETPLELPRPPAILPPLTSISLVRIFRVASNYVVVGANYESNGKLSSLHIEGAKEGKRIPLADEENIVNFSLKNQFLENRRLDKLKRYGIPSHIDLPAYLRSGKLSLLKTEWPESKTELGQHYGFNRLIRLDDLSNGATASTRFLRPSETQEETVLNPICEMRFRKQQEMGLQTVD